MAQVSEGLVFSWFTFTDKNGFVEIIEKWRQAEKSL
jgi:hypothetical protein